MLSVLSPVRNEAKFLRQMVSSLQQQTFTNWEALFVDDGSTDDTPSILESLALEDERIKVIPSTGPMGKVAAFNACFDASEGDAICHVGGDDTLPPNSFHDRYTPLQELAGTAVTFCKFRTMDHSGQVTSGALPRGRRGSTSSAGTTMNRAMAEALFPIPEELPAEDIWLGRGSEYSAGTVIHSNSVVLNYRQHGGNSNPRHRSFRDMTEGIHARQRAKQLLALDETIPMSSEGRSQLMQEWRMEVLRYRGDLIGLTREPHVATSERLATLSMANPIAWRLRQALGTLATGWRGR